MTDAVYAMTHVQLSAGEYQFFATSSRISFDGFMSVYHEEGEEKTAKTNLAGLLTQGMKLSLQDKQYQQY